MRGELSMKCLKADIQEEMIDRTYALPVSRQAKLVGVSRRHLC
jgi:hypothetical protein